MKVRAKVKLPCADSRRGLLAFTMIEIAISLAVIGFALVAIIGILPLGLNVQKDNREDTIISQDGKYWMDVLRFGRQGTNGFQGTALDFLTNYVETINVKTYVGNGLNISNLVSDVTFATLDAPESVPPGSRILTNGHVIAGMLSIPKYKPSNQPGMMERNDVVATVRAMSGSALEQNGGNQLVAFRYQLEVWMMPYSTTPWMNDIYTNYSVGISSFTTQTNPAVVLKQVQYWQNNLVDLRLQFSWPVLGDGSPGPSRKYFRTLATGQLTNIDQNLRLYVINPGAYRESTNTGVFQRFED